MVLTRLVEHLQIGVHVETASTIDIYHNSVPGKIKIQHDNMTLLQKLVRNLLLLLQIQYEGEHVVWNSDRLGEFQC